MLVANRLALALLGLGFLTAEATAEVTAGDVIERSVAAYSRLDEFAGRLDFTIVLPDGRVDKKRLAYGRRGESAFQALLLPDGTPGLEMVAHRGRLYASQFNVPNAYVDAPYGGDLPAALEGIGAAQVGLALPAPLAAAMTGDTDQFLTGLGFGVLGPLAIGALETVEEDGRSEYRVELVAENGTCTAFIDSSSYLLTGFSAVVGEGEHQVRGSGKFAVTATSELARRLNFEPSGRKAVEDFAALEASAYPLGGPAPIQAIPNLAGEPVSLADLRGSVVVLDFWATWCVPCWSTLEEAQKLADWAESSGRPVAVFAVNTLEKPDDFGETRATIQEFFDERGLTLPVLVDTDDSFFEAMHTPGLPSTILIAPDGTLARFHAGVVPDMAEALQREVEELLGETG